MPTGRGDPTSTESGGVLATKVGGGHLVASCEWGAEHPLAAGLRRAPHRLDVDDRVKQMCAQAERIAEQWPAGEALWVWLRHIAQHCAAEKALAALLRNAYGDTAAQNRSVGLLGRAGQKLFDRAAAAGTVQQGVTLEELLLLVNAVADVCSDNGADLDRLLNLAWNGGRRASTATN